MKQEVHIASLIVLAQPTHLSEVQDSIAALSGVDVAVTDPSGKLIVTIETNTNTPETDLLATIDAINAINGVITSNLVYHQVADPASLEEIIDHANHPT